MFVRAAMALSLLSGVGVADAAAATGDLPQKPGASGCLSVIGFCSSGRALDGAGSVTVSPDGQNAYVASQVSDAVAVFDRGADGTLTQKPGTAGCISNTGAGPLRRRHGARRPFAVTVSPDGDSAYVASVVSDAVAVFDRAANGRLPRRLARRAASRTPERVPCADGTALDGAVSVTVSPDGSTPTSRPAAAARWRCSTAPPTAR